MTSLTRAVHAYLDALVAIDPHNPLGGPGMAIALNSLPDPIVTAHGDGTATVDLGSITLSAVQIMYVLASQIASAQGGTVEDIASTLRKTFGDEFTL